MAGQVEIEASAQIWGPVRIYRWGDDGYLQRQEEYSPDEAVITAVFSPAESPGEVGHYDVRKREGG